MITFYKSMNSGCTHEKHDTLSRSAIAERVSESAGQAIEARSA